MFNTVTVALIDYELKSPTLAKVIISYTGDPTAETIKATLAKKLDYLATPVSASFKKLRNGVAVGFLRANKTIRNIDKKDEEQYRVLSSNILMDKSDSSLWDVKEGTAGKYLARHGKEDLTALVQAAVFRRPDLPKVHDVVIAKASRDELVAFVDAEGDMDYGFAVATNEEKVRVVSFNRRIPMNVEYDQVVSIQPVAVPKEIVSEVMASLTAEEKKEAAAYYQRLYGYSPEYVRQTIEQINQGTVL